MVAVLCYLAAFTASSLNFIREQYKMVRTEETSSGQLFLACKPLWWDYVTEAGEMLILVFGIHLSYASRNAFTQFQVRWKFQNWNCILVKYTYIYWTFKIFAGEAFLVCCDLRRGHRVWCILRATSLLRHHATSRLHVPGLLCTLAAHFYSSHPTHIHAEAVVPAQTGDSQSILIP